MYNRNLLSLLTILFIALVGMRYNIALLAWVMSVPLLLLVRQSKGSKAWAWVGFILQIAFFLQISKIVTEPIPLYFALMFSIPMALGAWLVIWVFEKVRRRIGELWGVFFFAALMSVMDWVAYTTSEMGSWGAIFYTQVESAALMQTVALFGMTFPSFFIYLSSAFIALFLAHKKFLYLKPAVVSLLLFLLLYSYGVWRIHLVAEGKHMNVAAITSTLMITPEGIPPKTYLEEGTKQLLDDTLEAINKGAKLIAWNEGATIIMPKEEETFVQKLSALSLQHHVALVIAYIVPIDGIKKFENKYLFIVEGKVVDEYFKYHPVPGEGAVRGKSIAKTITLEGVKVSGALCYDFDFPALGLALAGNNIDLAVVPSSDWKGIDPIHGQMATVRAIEGGYALLRPVRGATTIAVDGYGKIRASMNYFEANDRIMMTSLPMQRIETLYSKVGDLFVYLLLLFMGSTLLYTFKRS